MIHCAILLACHIETWQGTPNGCEAQELDGFPIAHHGARRRKYADADEMIWPLSLVRRRARHGKREARCSYTTSPLRDYRGVSGCSSYSIEWATLAHDNVSRHKLDTKLPFDIDKPFGRRSRCGTRATPEEKCWHMAQRAADFADRRAKFCADADQHQPQRNHESLTLRGAQECSSTYLPRISGALHFNPAGLHHKKKADNTPPAFGGYRDPSPYPRPKRIAPPALGCPPTHASALHAQRTRTHFTPQHWLLCHMGLY